jgi:phosphoglycolate phosphatase
MTAGVLFDLDGTLVDTAPDLGHALNELRREHGLPPLAAAQIRPCASAGARGLLWLGFGQRPGDAGYEALRLRFLDIYADNLLRESRVFDGIDELIAQVRRRGMLWGIVTNKPSRFTDPLVQGLGFREPPACIVSGDSATHAKPHPAPMLLACRIAGIRPEHCVYVGDAARDIQAGRSAGMRTVAAAYGYIEPGDDPRQWQADGMIHAPLELLDWLGSTGNRQPR